MVGRRAEAKMITSSMRSIITIACTVIGLQLLSLLCRPLSFVCTYPTVTAFLINTVPCLKSFKTPFTRTQLKGIKT